VPLCYLFSYLRHRGFKKIKDRDLPYNVLAYSHPKFRRDAAVELQTFSKKAEPPAVGPADPPVGAHNNSGIPPPSALARALSARAAQGYGESWNEEGAADKNTIMLGQQQKMMEGGAGAAAAAAMAAGFANPHYGFLGAGAAGMGMGMPGMSMMGMGMGGGAMSDDHQRLMFQSVMLQQQQQQQQRQMMLQQELFFAERQRQQQQQQHQALFLEAAAAERAAAQQYAAQMGFPPTSKYPPF